MATSNKADPRLHGYRSPNHHTASLPVSKALRNEARAELTAEQVEWVRQCRMIHNGLGSWANALLINGWSIEQVKAKLADLSAQIQAL